MHVFAEHHVRLRVAENYCAIIDYFQQSKYLLLTKTGSELSVNYSVISKMWMIGYNSINGGLFESLRSGPIKSEQSAGKDATSAAFLQKELCCPHVE